MTNILSRDEEIITLLANTVISNSEVGRMYGISRERVRQILQKSGVVKMKKVIVKSPLQLAKESGLSWCSSCKSTDKHLTKNGSNNGKQYYRCNDCLNKRRKEYYATPHGKEAILRAKKNYEQKQKIIR